MISIPLTRTHYSVDNPIRNSTASVKRDVTHRIHPRDIYPVDNRSFIPWTTVIHGICHPQDKQWVCVIHRIYPQDRDGYPQDKTALPTAYIHSVTVIHGICT